MNKHRSAWCSAGLLLVLLLATAWPVAAGGSGVCLVTELAGTGTFQAPGGESHPITPFMKLKEGDQVLLSPGSRMHLVYFSNGRREVWQDEARITVGREGATPQTGAVAQVGALPGVVAKEVQRVVAIIDTERMIRSGGYLIRGAGGDEAAPVAPVELATSEEREVALARDMYRTLRSQAADTDISPELFLFSVLADFDQHQAMAELITTMRARQPDNREIDLLENWLRRQ
ncbi:MAG: hypothetical protein AB1634_07615 [Thermodesulfobacteriota bacterium]